jgi:hypothetical protein
VGTAGNIMPVIRYTPKDFGRLMRYEDMLRLIAGHGIDITQSLAQDGWTKALFQWPFLAVLGRADYAISIYGAKISPQSIQDVFATDARVRRFRLATDEDGSYTVMTVDIELWTASIWRIITAEPFWSGCSNSTSTTAMRTRSTQKRWCPACECTTTVRVRLPNRRRRSNRRLSS